MTLVSLLAFYRRPVLSITLKLRISVAFAKEKNSPSKKVSYSVLKQ